MTFRATRRSCRWRRVLLPAVILVAGALPAAGQVTISVTSATVSEPGEMTQICVLLDPGGVVVAGTQNELVWDGTCATITDPRFSCQASPGHGKQLSSAFPPGRDFTLRAFVLSLSDTNPINQRELYCCSVRSELTEPGTSCPIRVTNPGASSPEGLALRAQSGPPGSISYAGSGREREPIQRQPAGGLRPAPAVGGNVGAAAPAADAGGAAPPPAGGPATGGAPPPAMVLPGGGEQAIADAAPSEPVESAREVRPAEPAAPAGAAAPPFPEAVLPADVPPVAEPGAESLAAPEVPQGEPAPAVVAIAPEEEQAPAPVSQPVATAPHPTSTSTVHPTATRPAPPALPPADTAGKGPISWWAAALLLLAPLGFILWRLRVREARNRKN